ncbi:MAG: FAD:protein FMN transferase [Desulfobulbaceae bacterium]|nr:FAD:protein FMN transferase [Desulfobulbaceae bacterium]
MSEPKPKKINLNRRRVLQIFAIAGAVGAFRFLPKELHDSGFHVIRKSYPLMGTILNLVVYSHDREKGDAAISETFSTMQKIESKLSRHANNSEVAQLNQTGILHGASDDLLSVLELAQSVSTMTSGSFDITILPLLSLYQSQPSEKLLHQQSRINEAVKTVNHNDIITNERMIKFTKQNMGITLDGIGKGYIVDQGMATLSRMGFNQVYVEAGGDLLVKGGKPKNEPWRIGLQNPRPSMPQELVVIETDSLAVATSGDYYQPFSPDFRFHHIINPRTGFSSPELASCTVTAPNAALADALATGCMVLGAKDAIALLEEIPECQGYMVSKDLTVHKTSGFNS